MRSIGVLVLVVGLLPVSAAAAPAPVCPAPAAMSDGWPVAPPAKERLDPKVICAIGPKLAILTEADPNGVVVVRHGVLVYERYFVAGTGSGADTLHGLHSVTKSIVALLTGIAFDRGWLEGINAPVLSFFPEYADLRTQDKYQITLRDLLTMTSGLKWPETTVSYTNPGNIEERMDIAPDPYRFVLARPFVASPGTVWNYDSGSAELLGDILMKVSHEPLDKFAREDLFDPLGIRDWEWARSPNGKFGAAWGLYPRPRDLAKIGQLVLNHGAWHGHQIVSAKWITEMTSRQLARWWPFQGGDLHAYSYGYLWWLGRSRVGGREIDWVAGVGLGGQRLYVVPSEDLVAVVTAGVYCGSYRAQDLAGNTALDMALSAAMTN
jgi:CubicO group peptidase (beta-lactamase class C family)